MTHLVEIRLKKKEQIIIKASSNRGFIRRKNKVKKENYRSSRIKFSFGELSTTYKTRGGNNFLKDSSENGI